MNRSLFKKKKYDWKRKSIVRNGGTGIWETLWLNVVETKWPVAECSRRDIQYKAFRDGTAKKYLYIKTQETES